MFRIVLSSNAWFQVRQVPGGPIIDGHEPVGFFIADDAFLNGVPDDLAPGAQGDVAQVRHGGNMVADLEVLDRLLPGLDAVEEIAHMGRAGIGAAGEFLGSRLSLLGSRRISQPLSLMTRVPSVPVNDMPQGRL